MRANTTTVYQAGPELESWLAPRVLACDVYFICPHGMRWGSAGAPRPEFWMHQMSKVREGPVLDPKVFAAEVAKRTSGH
jgi:hypothetical protein